MPGETVFATLPQAVEYQFLGDLDANQLSYGEATSYDSLLSLSVPILSHSEKCALDQDLVLLWEFYRTMTQLYLGAIDGAQPSWLVQLVEHGLSKTEIAVHRAVCRAGLEPRLCRVDYVSVGDRRKLAEVQWKTGGPGLFVGVHDLHAKLSAPHLAGTRVLGDFGGEFRAALRNRGRDGVVINDVRDMWLKGERYLRSALKDDSYVPVVRTGLSKTLHLSRGRLYYVDARGRSRMVDALHGQEFTNAISEKLLTEITDLSLDSNLWVETPLNFIYRQKWVLALPFLGEFHSHFPDRLRDILPVGGLLNVGPLSLDALVGVIDHPEAERLRTLESLIEIADLPSGLRKRLVLKCGSGNGQYYNRGRGVFRIGGSSSSARRTLQLVADRVSHGEPWILQEYVDQKYRVSLAEPVTPLTFFARDCHARFMIYGRNDSGHCRCIAGLANFATHWKVSGRSWDRASKSLSGSSFSEIRYAEDDSNDHSSLDTSDSRGQPV